MIQLKRAYQAPAATDGPRFLVDRLWPRGISKGSLNLQAWLKDIAPSDELRRWYAHDEEHWLEFRQRYRLELKQKIELLQPLLEAARAGDMTLVYSTRHEQRNNAVALKEFLEEFLVL